MSGVWIIRNSEGNIGGVFTTAEIAMQKFPGAWITVGMNKYQLKEAGEVYRLTYWQLDQ